MSSRKYLMWDGYEFHLRHNSKVKKLGSVATRKGRLTRAQKLNAIAHEYEWVEI